MYLPTETTKIKLQTDQVEEKDIITVTITVLHMFKKLEVRLSMLSRHMEDIKKYSNWTLGNKNSMELTAE